MVQRQNLQGLICCLVLSAASTHAFDLEFSSADFDITPVFSNVQTFQFLISIDEPLRTGAFSNPTLQIVDYLVFGQLAPGTPSGFPSFALERTIVGSEFYDQGSSLSFEIAADADLTDGLQASELIGLDPVYLLNAREVDTGRYHPPLFQLNADGSGSIRNSNNFGGINPATGLFVDVDFGEEYISDLAFVPSALTLITGNGVDGDFNNDGLWNCQDIDALTAEIANGGTDLSFDMNFDEVIDHADLTTPGTGWLTVSGRKNPDATGGNPLLVGDINLDGIVDGLDFIAWNERKFTMTTGWCQGDLDANGIVDGVDFTLWNDNKFTSSGAAPLVVPEPIGCGLLISGLIGGLAMRHHRLPPNQPVA